MSNFGTIFRKDGKYLQYSKRTGHTGHCEVNWVDNLNLATIFYIPPPRQLRNAELKDAESLEAIETRVITLQAGGS